LYFYFSVAPNGREQISKCAPAQHQSLHLYIGKKSILNESHAPTIEAGGRVRQAISTMHGVLDYLLKGSDTTYHTQIYEE